MIDKTKFYKVYSYIGVYTEGTVPVDNKYDTYHLEEITPTGEEIAEIISAEIENANYHSWTEAPIHLYKILEKYIPSTEMIDNVMRAIYEEGVFDIG